MNEDDLRRQFQELRQDEARAVPPFERIAVRRVRTRWRLLPLVVAVSLLVVITLAVVRWRERAAFQAGVPPIATWRAPTDVLLRTSNSDLLRNVPSFGSTRKGTTL